MREEIPWDAWLTWPELHGRERQITLCAGPEALARIARGLDLEGLERLEAELDLKPWLDGVEINGRVVALAGRRCGVSLEPFDEAIDEPLLIRIVPAGSPNAPRSEGEALVIDIDAEDPPDEAAGESIELAAYVVEALALALDPFPRKPGAVFEPPEATEPASPFAVLSQLSKRPPPA